MYRISKEFTFAMAHRLSCHKGACKNIHGHNYRIIVGVKSEKLNDEGMVIDFSDLKIIVGSFLDTMDHALMLNEVDEELTKKIKEVFPTFKVIKVPFEPTAENMAREIFEHVSQSLDNMWRFEHTGHPLDKIPDFKIDYITVYETDTSEATYSLD